MKRAGKTSIALLVVAALVVWWLLRDKPAAAAAAAPDPGRVKREIEVEADVYSPNFGKTQAEIDAEKNPAVNDEMRELINRSNAAIAADDYYTIDPSDLEAP